MQNCAWYKVNTSLLHALSTLVESQGPWLLYGHLTSALTNIKFSLSHKALFALNSVYGDVDIAVLIHFACICLMSSIRVGPHYSRDIVSTSPKDRKPCRCSSSLHKKAQYLYTIIQFSLYFVCRPLTMSNMKLKLYKQLVYSIVQEMSKKPVCIQWIQLHLNIFCPW